MNKRLEIPTDHQVPCTKLIMWAILELSPEFKGFEQQIQIESPDCGGTDSTMNVLNLFIILSRILKPKMFSLK